MKTNLTDLMQRVATLDKEKNRLYRKLNSDKMNVKTIELDGNEQILEENKNFNEDFKRFEQVILLISYLKGIIDAKNNTFTLENGLTIKQAILQNRALETEYSLVDSLADESETKRRVSETTNSYFEVRTPAYNVDDMKAKREEIKALIQANETGIISLNGQEFEIDDEMLSKLGYNA